VEVGERSDEEVASVLRELEVDIAVDLMGYTKSSRPGIFARRAAPVQVNYLGYPGTLGADFMDYIVADEFVIPRAAAVHYAERVAYLPECFQGNDGRREVPAEPPSRGSCGLPERGVVYCCFNNSYKINPQIFEVWCRVLGQVPGSVLWLLGEGEEAGENLRREGLARGIAQPRIVLAGRLPYAQHLRRLALADLFLDTLPFNAGTTASDALWAGVPVLTCAGEAYAARMAGSLLHTMGLDELITGSLSEYEQRAVQLGSEPERLAGLKARVCAQRSAGVLFDTPRFTRHLEAAYLTMWARAGRAEPPESFAVAPGAAGPVR
jgi:predicted O-linked N-acetylglucosamine transferase (SPINDLY family)